MDTRALIELLLLGAAAAPLGVWVLLFRSTFAAESLAHGMLPGLVAATALGFPVLLGGIAGAAVAAVLIALAGRDVRLGTDTGISIVTTALFGAGSLLAATGLADEHELEPLLFGDLDSITDGDLALAAALALATPPTLAIAHRSLARDAFGQKAAPVLVLALLGVVFAVAADVVGALLALALVVGPAAAALLAARRLPATLVGAAATAAVIATAGLALAEPIEAPASALVALCTVAAVPLAAIAAHRTR